MYEISKLIHLIAAIVWMGGMTFMLFALRPAALATLDTQPRARLMSEVWRRFFLLVLVAVVLLFFTGMNLYTTAFRATRLATGSGAVPLGWNVMLALGLLMFAVFGGFSQIQARSGRWRMVARGVCCIANPQAGDG
jgi:uncharacterized membrane protein